MFLWRPVLAHIATLTEIRENWDINDLADANEALDLQSEIEEKYAKHIKENSK